MWLSCRVVSGVAEIRSQLKVLQAKPGVTGQVETQALVLCPHSLRPWRSTSGSKRLKQGCSPGLAVCCTYFSSSLSTKGKQEMITKSLLKQNRSQLGDSVLNDKKKTMAAGPQRWVGSEWGWGGCVCRCACVWICVSRYSCVPSLH